MADPTPPSASIAPDADPLAKLHKMSTTAGLGSGDYVAVNVLAVVCAVLGFASALALLNETLLAFPIAGVVCGIIAIRKIRGSGGTQTGTGIAAVGILLSLGLGGYVIAQNILQYTSSRGDEKQIVALIDALGQSIAQNKPDAAYDLFDGEFQGRVPKTEFVSRLNFFASPQAKDLYGALTAIRWNGQIAFDVDPKTGSPTAFTYGLMKFAKASSGDLGRESMFFRKLADKWKIDAMPDLFPPPPKKSGADGGDATPSGPAGPASPRS